MNTIGLKMKTLLTVFGFLFIFVGPANAQKETNFRLAWKYGPEDAGYFIALDKGYFKAEGLDVKIAQGFGSLENVKLLGAGELKIAEVDAGALLTGRSRGIPVVSLAVLYQKLPMGLVSLKKTKLAEPKDLLGLRIGRNPKSVTSVGLDAFIALQKLDKAKIQLVPTGLGQEPLLAGAVDAQTTFVNTDAAVLRSKGYEVNVLLFADWGLRGYSRTLGATEKSLSTDEKMIAALVRASIKGWKDAMSDFRLGARVMNKYHKDIDQAFALQVLEVTRPLTVSEATQARGLGWQTEEGWSQTQDLYFAAGMLKEKVDVKKVFSTKYLE